MSRLPKPGQDADIWGNLLNDFLSVEHNADGTLKIRTDSTLLQPTTLISGDLTGNYAAPRLAKLHGVPLGLAAPSDGQVLTYSAASNQWAASTIASPVIPDATSSAPGTIQLTGDLGGSATSPTTPTAIHITGSEVVTGMKTFNVNAFLDKGNQHYDVKAYGAAGDGTTDDTAAINAAINDAITNSNGPAVVYLPRGTYKISSHLLAVSNLTVIAEGWNMAGNKGSVITTASGGAFNIIDMDKSVYNASSPITNFRLINIEIDGRNLDKTSGWKCINGGCFKDSFMDYVYAHYSPATGIGDDDFYGMTLFRCLVEDCGYMNPHTIVAASWSSNVFTFQTRGSHDYSTGDVIVVTGMVPAGYNNKYVVSSVVNSTTFTVDDSNNPANLTLAQDPGTATAFGQTSDSLIGHNGIGIASGALGQEACKVIQCIARRNQNNNFLIEDDYTGTGDDAFYLFDGCVSEQAGQYGFRNTGTRNVLIANSFDYGSFGGAYVVKVNIAMNIVAASWFGGIATFTIDTSSHNTSSLRVSNYVIIQSVTPSSYNGYWQITGITSSNQFTVAMAASPGGSGTASGAMSYVVHPTGNTTFDNFTTVDNVSYGIRLDSWSDGLTINNATISNCRNYGIYAASGHLYINNPKINGCGLQAINILSGTNNYMPMDTIQIIGGEVRNGGQLSALKDGISIVANGSTPITNVLILGVHSHDDQLTQTQRYGLYLNGSGLSNVTVEANFSSNQTGPVYVDSSVQNVSVKNSVGVNPQSSIALGNIGGTATFDITQAAVYAGTLTANVAATMPNAYINGDTMTWLLYQDSTGGRSLMLPVNAYAQDGTHALPLSTMAGVLDVVTWVYDTTTNKWHVQNSAFYRARSIAEGGTGATTQAGAANALLPTQTGSSGKFLTTDGSNVSWGNPAASAALSVVDSNGNNILTGTAAASAVSYLNVTNATSGGTVILAVVGGSNNNFILKGSGTGIYAMRPGSDSANAWRVQNAAGTSNVIVADTSNTRLGIGKTSPTTALDVNGTTTTTKLNVATGANAATGTGTLSAGTVTVSNTTVTANSLIFLTPTSRSANSGVLSVSAVTAGTSFTVNSSNNSDVSTFNWWIIN